MDAQWSMGLGGGLVVANPISESLGMPRDIIDDAIQKALTEMNDRNLRGKESTPFLLARVAELTGGDSLRSNIALVESNVALGARIAVAYSRRQSAPI
jgi:pseudouridine-5'-phosphate glycosidase